MDGNDTLRTIVRLDDGGVNTRILARETVVDFRRVESAGIKLSVRLCSADGKRMFVRSFNSFQLLNHYISTIARTRLEDERIRPLEEGMKAAVDGVSAKLDRAIDEADRLFKVHAVAQLASYDTVPLEMKVSVLSSLARRYLEAIGKLDQLMPLLQTLEIYEICCASQLDQQRAALKRELRQVVREARLMAAGVRRDMARLNEKLPGGGPLDPPDDIGDLILSAVDHVQSQDPQTLAH